VALAVCQRPLTAEACFRFQVSPCVFCGGHSDTGAVFSASTVVLPSQYHSSGVPFSHPFIRSRTNPGGVEIFHTHPDWPWSSPSLLTVEYWISLPGLKQPELGIDYPPLLAPRLKKEQSYICTPIWAFMTC